ncbi:MAG: sigma-70 family RNA polymerase sigma factor [Acidimicrobiia bacterium]|nr:sigma-70 family RNA polymerase sigma factor [Acidimicrobiia bacterium]MBT8247886.1 sigma-70 family RNA polymerase sigma factor [Acidimicrobiia bacterium]NNJ48185.1 sigma-70 family RNA polymerase sigma factor [Acidimicrobiia bacterium]NNL69065.1 sigma-70 family RNA polymerase sigma factor [Acidimicrobiia bacterium]
MTADEPTAEQVVGTLAPRDFEDFYRSRREQVFRGLALTLRDRDLAADATDEAMARAYQRWRSVSGYNNPEGWVYRVGLNWARSRMRRTKREVRGFRLEDRPAAELTPADPSLAAALEELPVEQRAVVVLRCYFDWSTEQVAKALGVPKGTVKSRLARALERLESNVEVAR